MPRPSPYTDKQKTAILEAVKAGRRHGKKWPEIFDAAKAEGFKGGLPYLVTMSKAAGAVRRRRHTASTAAIPKRRPGRPKGSVTNDAGLSDIDRIVKQMVEQRVSTSIANAIKVLEDAADELKAL